MAQILFLCATLFVNFLLILRFYIRALPCFVPTTVKI